MSVLLRAPPSESAVLQTALTVVVVGLIVAAARLFEPLARRKGAALASALWTCALLAVLACPLLRFVWACFGAPAPLLGANQEIHLANPLGGSSKVDPYILASTNRPVMASYETHQSANETSTTERPLLSSATDSQRHAVVARPVHHSRFAVVFFILEAIYGIGVLLAMLRLWRGWRQVRRIRRQLTPLTENRSKISWDNLRRRLQVNQLPQVMTSPGEHSPMVLGIRRPVIVLPRRIWELLSPGELEDVVVHEAAHVLRRDTLIGVAQRLAAILFWPHPMIHYLNRRLSLAREQACDDYVRCGGPPIRFAGALLKIAEQNDLNKPLFSTIGLWGNWLPGKAILERRIANLLHERNKTMTKVNKVLLAAIAFAFFALTTFVSAIGVDETQTSSPLKRAIPTAKPIPDSAATPAATAAEHPSGKRIEKSPIDDSDSSADRIWSDLGVKLTPLPAVENELLAGRFRGGLRITKVREKSVAAKNKIRPGDILVGLHVWETLTPKNVHYALQQMRRRDVSAAKIFIVRQRETLFGLWPGAEREGASVVQAMTKPAALNVIRLRFVEAQETAQLLEKILRRANMSIIAEHRSNSVIVAGDKKLITEVEKLIQRLDRRDPGKAREGAPLVPQRKSSRTFVRTHNFIVQCSSKRSAQEVADWAETLRRSLSFQWLGKELPKWSDPCQIRVEQLEQKAGKRGGGHTSFMFTDGKVYGLRMVLTGTRGGIMYDSLPHEILHTVFATHFGRPLPRWADEGACLLQESPQSLRKLKQQYLALRDSGRLLNWKKLLELKDYPSDVVPMYVQGLMLTELLIERSDRHTFVRFLEVGLESGNWERALRNVYMIDNLEKLDALMQKRYK